VARASFPTFVTFQPHLHANAIPECREPGVIHLQQQPGLCDHPVLLAHGFGECEDKLLLGFVGQIVPAGLETTVLRVLAGFC
jgi:hypothetical protein